MSTIIARFEGNIVVINLPSDLFPMAKGILDGRWDRMNRIWRYPDSASSAKRVVDALGHIATVEPSVLESAAEHTARLHTFSDADLAQPPVRVLDAWRHQLEAYHYAIKAPTLLALDMGTGKTKVMYDIMQNSEWQHRAGIVFCPAAVIDVWPTEAAKHVVPGDNALTTITLRGPIAERTQVIEFMRKQRRFRPRLFVTNYESLGNDGFVKALRKHRWDYIIADESHKVKSHTGVHSKALSSLGPLAEHRYLMTGTPMPNNPLDIFAQYRFLNPSVFGRNFTHFRARYAIMGGYMNRQILAYQNTDELEREIWQHGIRVDKSVLDLPPFHHITRTCNLAPETRRIYDELEADMYTVINTLSEPPDELAVNNVLTKLLRLEQITGGHAEGKQIGKEKANLLFEVLDELPEDEPVVIFARFKDDLAAIEQVCKDLGRGYLELSGSHNHLRFWQQGNHPILGVQIQSGSAGVDLTRARYAIYYSTGYNNGDYEQSIARVHRPGQTRSTIYIHLQARSTIDAIIARALDKKRRIISQFMHYKDER